ncbi:MAG: hypothetical protein IJ141_00080 [Lachnospiraceae bacterium]|nr:hypothetical protein [Lachnospiraceae bacterium]
MPKSSANKIQTPQQRASEKWEESHPMDKIILRLPAGANQVIKDYVSKKAEADPFNKKFSTDKGRPSVNAFIKSLIEDELNTKF